MAKKMKNFRWLYLTSFVFNFYFSMPVVGSFKDENMLKIALDKSMELEGLPDSSTEDISFDSESDKESFPVNEGSQVFFYENPNGIWVKELSFGEGFGFEFNFGYLYVFAFNVGQANCIVLRKGEKCVIVDAGGTFYKKSDEDQVLKRKFSSAIDATIDAVFVTHPHQDHYSLLCNSMCTSKFTETTQFFLGGSNVDLEGGKPGSLLSKFCAVLKNYQVDYVETLKTFSSKFLDDVDFEILKAPPAAAGGSKNRKSFLLKVTYDGKSMLFTGDSEGEAVDRHAKTALNYRQVLDLASICHECSISQPSLSSFASPEECRNAFYKQLKETVPIFRYPATADEFMGDFNAFHEVGMENREKISSAYLIFLPHHGTNTANSQRWIGYFSNDRKQHCFVVSSSPFGPDAIPKRSTLELAARIPTHLMHPFVYRQDNAKKYGFRMTTRPIYLTGVAPGGVECFVLSKGNPKIQKLDVYKRDDGKNFRWFDI